jgi:GDP-D-mannose dehydratase
MKRAIVTGVTGQDGTYLTALLIEMGFKVLARTAAIVLSICGV